VYHTIAIALSFALVVALLRFGWKVGRALLLSAALLTLFLPARWPQLSEFLVRDWEARPWPRTFPVQTADLVVLVILVNFLGETMKEFGLRSRLPGSLRQLLRSRRLAIAGVPAMMGLLPTPGGIMLSAPIVKEVASEYGVPPARASAINYWFRHVWEYTFPLFPALPLMSGIVGAPIGAVILRNLHVSAASLFFGAIFLLRSFPSGGAAPGVGGKGLLSSFADVFGALWPVLLALGLCTAVRLPAGAALAISMGLLVLIRRVEPRKTWKMLKASFEVDLVMVVLAAMSYRAVLDASGAVVSVSGVITGMGLPVTVLVFVLPFFVGMIVGVSSAMAGLSCPLLLAFLMKDGQVRYDLLTLVLFGGMSGVLLTPVHLCLALSKDYFGVKFSQLYKYMIPLVACTAAVVWLVALLWPGG
jgi:integral membrane protein (TIGR00529 family)